MELEPKLKARLRCDGVLFLHLKLHRLIKETSGRVTAVTCRRRKREEGPSASKGSQTPERSPYAE